MAGEAGVVVGVAGRFVGLAGVVEDAREAGGVLATGVELATGAVLVSSPQAASSNTNPNQAINLKPILLEFVILVFTIFLSFLLPDQNNQVIISEVTLWQLIPINSSLCLNFEGLAMCYLKPITKKEN